MIEKTILLEIDGKNIEVEEGTTVLEAAEKLDIKIPTLCFHKALLPYGACRLCLVEVNLKDGPSSMQTSCTYPCLAGLIVGTDTEKVIRTRKIIMELLLARSPDSEKVKTLAKEMGVKESRISPQNKDCILCGLCVRMCDEKMGRAAIGFVGRGQKKEVKSPFGKPNEVCQACGACDFVCPTKKIICSDVSKVKPIPMPYEFNAGLNSRGAAYILYPQAVPNKPAIDESYCVHMVTGKCGICKDICEAKAIDYEQKEEKIEIDAGAVVLASGVKLFDAGIKKEYGYDRYDNVITSIQFERILSSSGPTAGEIQRPSDGRIPKRIAFIQCVGSRDPSCGNEFCSAVCCMYSIKEAVIAREHHSEIEPTIFYIDIRTFGKDFERYYDNARKDYGVKFIRCMISKIYERPKSKNLMVKYINEAGRIQEAEFDMAVLAVGMSSTIELKTLADKLGIKTNEYGFCGTDRNKPGLTSKAGIFVAGTSAEPKDIPETVAEGSSSAALAHALLKDARGSLVKKKEYPMERNVLGEEPRIGAFICRCGRNIASVVDVPEVVRYASKLEEVVYAGEFLYSCSKDALDEIKKKISEFNLNRVVVASCTPRTHEELFRDTVREAGLNRYLFEMTSLREQVSWVHKDCLKAATEKSKELVGMMVAKARLIKPLERQFSEVIQKALVIGGGASGMQASLLLSKQGFEVYLVEKENSLGGHLRELFYNSDGKEAPRQLLKELTDAVYADEKIHIMTNSRIKSIAGFTGNYISSIDTNGEEKEIKHGTVIVATGARSYEPKKKEFGYGESQKVISQVELEKRLTETPQDFRRPQTFVMIQCVGSRNEEHPYCSRVCCGHATKNVLKLKSLNREHRIIVLYRDIRTYGFLERNYLEARESGAVFLSFNEDNKPQVKMEADSIKVLHTDILLKETMAFKTDWVILSTGIISGENDELAKILKVPLNADGFFLEAHAKIRPLDFTTDGIFFCGLAHSPRFLHESLTQAQAASQRAATILTKDKIEAKAITACVNERLCRGCGLCVTACPYEAREIDEETNTAKVIDLLCQGCGACAVACPSGATTHKGFSKNEIMAMVDEAT